MNQIPTIDLQRVSAQDIIDLDRACQDHGFFFITGHELDDRLERVLSASQAFFDSPQEAKHKYMRTSDNPFGYYDRELTKRKRDLKEVFDFYVPKKGSASIMTWPDEPEGFEAALTAYFEQCAVAAERCLELIAQALGLESDAFAEHFAQGASSVARLNYYPSSDPLSTEQKSSTTPLGDMALHHHTDQCVITLLHQDNVGGLQAHSTEEGWIDVPPKPGALVVNIGDMVQIWSNGKYKAALHRVTPIPQGRSRLSVPFFCQPSMKATMSPHPALGEPIYRTFPWREFIEGRVSDNYSDQGDEDIQIDKYLNEAVS